MRGESDYIHADFPDSEESETRLGAFAALNILSMPNSRMAQKGRAYVLSCYNVTEEDLDRYRSLWESGYAGGA